MIARAVGLRIAVWGSFLALGLAAVVWSGLPVGAPGGAFAAAQSIAREGVPTIGGNTVLIGPLDAAARGIGYRAGEYWDTHPPAAALLAAPAAWMGVPLADALHAPGEAVLLVGMTGAFLLLAAAAALVWAGERMGMPPGAALVGAALGVGALLWPVGTFTDTTVLTALTGVLIALLLADGADARIELGWTPRGRLVTAGFILGLLPFVAWFGFVPLVALGLALVASGGARWWRRIGWLALGLAPMIAGYVAIMTTWFGSPFGTARQYGVGDGWARSLTGLYRATPLLAARVSGAALMQLILRHPLLVVGWVGLVIGLWFVPWRTRASVIVLLVSVGVPALFERQLPGGVAEEHPIAVLAPFAAAGYLLLVALVVRDRLRLLPATFALGAGLILIGAIASVTVRGVRVDRPALVPVVPTFDVLIAPVGLCVGMLLLLIVPALEAPRARTRQIWLGGSVALLLLPTLAGCGAVAPDSPRPATGVESAPNLLPPFGTRVITGVTEAVWTLKGAVQLAPDGMAVIVAGAGGGADSPQVPVQAGDRYRVALRLVGPPGVSAVGNARVISLDGAGASVSDIAMPLVTGANARIVAAAPGAVALQVVLTLPAGVAASEARVIPLDGGRLDAWPDYQRAALAFSFDWETAMGGLIHTRGGTKEHDIADAEARGIQMRAGAQFLRRTFDAYTLKATWYVNGYNFLTGNTAHRQFAGNPTYTRYNVPTAGFLTDYWTTHPWYGDDPFGTETANPAWYFGSLTKDWLADGQDIESHTFGHLFLHAGITPAQLDEDLTAWDMVARENDMPPAHSLAFPWGASNSLTAEYYAVFAKHGITSVTRFYDTKPGTYSIGTVPQRPTIRVMPDTQLISGNEQETISRRGDQTMAERGIDLTLASGGAWSLWTHPESVTTTAAQAMWGRVIGYAADHRRDGLWVAPVTTITNFAAARDGMRVTSYHVGDQTTITAMNEGLTPVVGATVTLAHAPPRVTYTGGNGTPDQRGAQIRLGTVGAGQRLTLMVSGS